MADPVLPDMTETDFLANETAVTKAAIANLKQEIVHNLGLAAKPTAWAEQYPLPSLGAAAAAGVAAAAVVKPMVLGADHKHANGQPAYYYAPPPPAAKPGVLAALTDVLKSVLKNALIAGATAQAAKTGAENAEADTPPPPPQ